jgi:hypothetical protein
MPHTPERGHRGNQNLSEKRSPIRIIRKSTSAKFVRFALASTPRLGPRPGHCDAISLKFLAQSALSGLEMRTAEDEWIRPPAVPGTFVVNTGAMLARYSSDRFRATPHRVINRYDASRYAGLRDRALIALMVYSFARIGAVLSMAVEDVYSTSIAEVVSNAA